MAETAKLTVDDWRAEAERRFGPDPQNWAFQCPACKAVHKTIDFAPFRDQGANAQSAAQQCIGRYTGGRSGPDKCDWAAYGLFRGPNFVIMEDGSDVPVFPFAPDPPGLVSTQGKGE